MVELQEWLVTLGIDPSNIQELFLEDVLLQDAQGGAQSKGLDAGEDNVKGKSRRRVIVVS